MRRGYCRAVLCGGSDGSGVVFAACAREVDFEIANVTGFVGLTWERDGCRHVEEMLRPVTVEIYLYMLVLVVCLWDRWI